MGKVWITVVRILLWTRMSQPCTAHNLEKHQKVHKYLWYSHFITYSIENNIFWVWAFSKDWNGFKCAKYDNIIRYSIYPDRVGLMYQLIFVINCCNLNLKWFCYCTNALFYSVLLLALWIRCKYLYNVYNYVLYYND